MRMIRLEEPHAPHRPVSFLIVCDLFWRWVAYVLAVLERPEDFHAIAKVLSCLVGKLSGLWEELAEPEAGRFTPRRLLLLPLELGVDRVALAGPRCHASDHRFRVLVPGSRLITRMPPE